MAFYHLVRADIPSLRTPYSAFLLTAPLYLTIAACRTERAAIFSTAALPRLLLPARATGAR